MHGQLGRLTQNRDGRLTTAAAICGAGSKICPPERATALLEAIIAPRDRVAIEGNNQKQANHLATALANADPVRLHDLHMVQPVLALPEHLAVFEKGIANRLDFAFAGPQSRKLAELVEAGWLKIGAIHTYLEIYARMFLVPNVALVVADKADPHGNLCTGPNTEDTPTLVEATAFRRGIVVAQVNEVVDRLPRAAAGILAPHGCGRARKPAKRSAGESSWCKWSRRNSPMGGPASLNGSMRSTWLRPRASR